jgi:co-chaperonin GroES (HSP10)
MKIKPLRDWVCIRPFSYEHPTLHVIGMTLHKGRVVAVGPGRRMRRKVAFKNHEENSDKVIFFEDGPEFGKTRAMRIKEGDVVEYSFRAGVPFQLGREELLMIPEQSIYGLTDESKHIAVFESRSAPVPI